MQDLESSGRSPRAGRTGRWWAALGGVLAAAHGWRVQANPAGLTVVAGSASASPAGSQIIVQASHNAVLDWKSFNILAGETTTFQQPSAQSVVWNRIYDQNPSQIWGHLNANGFVVLMNQSGFYFGPNSVINVGGFLATTAPAAPPGVGGGPMWQFNGVPPTASIINYGQVKVANGGALFLVAEKIENHGVLMAPDGTLGLYAGKEVLLSDSPDGRGLSVKVKLPEGSIDNTGKLIADAGTIALRAQVVNQNGLVQANSILDRHGVIELIATEAVHLGAGSSIQAKGDATAVSRGGEITIKSDQTYADDPASRISVAGGGQGGQGGAVEVSAASMAAIDSQIDGQAPAGWAGGQLLIDPANIVIGTTTTRYKIPASGVVDSTVKVVPEPLRLNINTSFKGFANITLQATHNISLDNNTVWNLSESTGKSLAGSVLRLEAGNDILFGDGSRVVAGKGWSLEMAAGADFSSPMHIPVGATKGGIYFNGGPPDLNGTVPNSSGSVETADAQGHITLLAASEVRFGTGHVLTLGGGTAETGAGRLRIEAGKDIVFGDGSGIVTGLGWSVQMAAGADFTTPLHVPTGATVGGIYFNGGPPDEFGNAPSGSGSLETSDLHGDITLVAASDVRVGSGHIRTVGGGNLSIATRTGDVNSGDGNNWYDFTSAGLAVSQAGLDGIGTTAGGNVTLVAGRDLISVLPTVGAYGGGDVQLTAGRHILGRYLVSDGVGQMTSYTDIGGDNQGVTLALIKGSWAAQAIGNPGAAIDNITTHSVFVNEVLNPNGVFNLNRMNTGAGIANQFDYAPDAAVHLSGYSVNLLGTSLARSGSTRDLSPIYPPILSVAAGAGGVSLANDVVLYPSAQGNLALTTTGGGSLQGLGEAHHLVMSDSTSPDYRTFLNGTKGLESKGVIYKPDGSYADPIHLGTAGQPVRLNISGSVQDLQLQIPKAATLHIGQNALDFTYEGQNLTPQDLTTLDVAGDIKMTSVNSRLWFGGPGKVDLFAGNLDLGNSGGIRSVAVAINPAVSIGADGQPIQASDLNVVVGYPAGNPAATPIAGAGQLDITASQIASFNGGSIAIHAAGSVHVGSQAQVSTDHTPKGIYTARGGDVTVEGLGDVVVSGSRIATYNGGDVTVISRDGGVDAGSGGKGFFSVSTLQYNPTTHRIENLTDKFFGSGIVALTDPKLKDTTTPVGNITVTAAKDVSANSGGVLQMAFNKSDIREAFVSLESQQGSILANNSGILGANVRLKAAQDITGLVVANQDISVKANNNVTITALGGGNVSVNAGGNFSGTAVGGGAVDVSGLSVSGTVFSAQGSTSVSGDSGNAKTSAFAGVAAPAASKATTDNDKVLAAVQKDDQEDPDQKKKKSIQLARSVSRVTVILPNKSQ